MFAKTPTVHLFLEIHSRVGDAIVAGLRTAKLDAKRFEGKTFASVWLSHQRQGEKAGDSLEEEGMIRVFGPALLEESEIYLERLQGVLTRTGCTVKTDTTVDD